MIHFLKSHFYDNEFSRERIALKLSLQFPFDSGAREENSKGFIPFVSSSDR